MKREVISYGSPTLLTTAAHQNMECISMEVITYQETPLHDVSSEECYHFH
jgi:hypothetical protein